ncbi:hypothetical protein MEQU1_002524 [Malassezia equina]|uniref:Oligomycin resistance ATP-dependent permease YOR1 n=1 Tax=Malassezia equina TaxID=1381935 RepID=A0AAF0J4A9_9BASI|nr:hypothetical protein MEQU1_002524 [Malassezia equina]
MPPQGPPHQFEQVGYQITPPDSEKYLEPDTKAPTTDASDTVIQPSRKQTSDTEAQDPNGHLKFGVRVREHWWQLWRFKNPPPPAPESIEEAEELPLGHANIFSDWSYHWIGQMLVLGYRRPLEATDLWKMDGPRQAEHLSNRVLERWEARVAKADAYNQKIQSGEIKPSKSMYRTWRKQARKELSEKLGGDASMDERVEAKAAIWGMPEVAHLKGVDITPELERKKLLAGKVKSSFKRANLFMACLDVFWPHILEAFMAKLLADVAQMCTALLIEHVIVSVATQDTGMGCVYTVVMFIMLVLGNFLSGRFFYKSLYVGVFCRAALVSGLFNRALNMQGRDRSTGKLTNHVSTDISRIDFGAQWWLLTFTAPVEIIVCLVILLTRFGVSCLSGFALVIVVTPIQMYTMKYLFKLRAKSMQWTDRRARRTQEVLSGMRIVKLFSYESNFVKLITDLRKGELKYVFALAVARAGLMATAISLPLLASVLAVVTYYYSHGHNFDVSRVFPAITLFQLLRLPLMFLPFGLSVMADGANSFSRLREVFYAEQHDTSLQSDENSPYGLNIQDATFVWEGVGEDETLKPVKKNEKRKDEQKKAKQKRMWAFLRHHRKSNEATLKKRRIFRRKTNKVPAAVEAEPKVAEAVKEEDEDDMFIMDRVNLQVRRGHLCAIIGPVGSGKSSLLLGAIGEMRKTSGDVTWSSPRVAFCSQSAWIQNATVRDNIVFGQPWDEERYWSCVERAELMSDLALLQGGDMTEIGEKGVTLSGGQKQRVNIARALYYDAEVLCLDDPLSAVDAHVGKALFNNAILPARNAGKTVILVTHAIQHLPMCDQIVVMNDGHIEEDGTYAELMAQRGDFYNTMINFGMLKEEGEEEEDAEELAAEAEGVKPRKVFTLAEVHKPGHGKTMESEERNTGAVDGAVWMSYLKAGRSWFIIPLVLLAGSCMQASVNLSSYWIVWWEKWVLQGLTRTGLEVGIYVMLGIMQLIFNFVMDVALGLLTVFASRALHDRAIKRVMYSPMAWFDTTPIGRIINRFGKDIDVLDNQLSNLIRQCASTVLSILGAAIMIIVFTYYFVIVVVFVFVFAYFFSSFYRSSAREFKRVDALLRSKLYSHFAESLTGLTTIRAYRESARFLRDNYKYMDLQNRAYFLTIVNQRWLGLRLDILGSLCVLVTGLLCAARVGGVDPSTAGVALSQVVTVAQTLGFLTRQLTELENEMNSAERLVYYANELGVEAPQQIPETAPEASWPQHGEVELRDVWLRYRPNLPNVLKGVSFRVRGSEKVGIVGRTGAGKSSILTVLLRLSEATQGSVIIDGVDVAKIGLENLRRSIAILPQEPLLFSGTLRSNLDPFGRFDDARLWDAMHRSYLTAASASVPGTGAVTPVVGADGQPLSTEDQPAQSKALTRLNLDSVIDEEGANLSVGQRSLVSLARALVKDSKIILLDEATASVDLETDAKIQRTIRTEFADRTLLCIAHRLSTIIGYDKICVMDDGKVAEFDTPLRLFDDVNSIFRGMCDRSGIKREEVLTAHAIVSGGDLNTGSAPAAPAMGHNATLVDPPSYDQ